ncbi:MAG TPA: prepilin-type N-terminal cleavage/methylation domain-containing protein [Acidimicrobiales bacterium]
MFQSVLRRLRERQTDELEGMGAAEAGFTLIELMVVLLIIAILLAIAIPTFLGVTSSANDRAAQSNLTNALTEATAQYQSSGQSYAGISALLNSSAPEYAWASGSGTVTTSSSNLTTDGCASTFTNCINVAEYDVAAASDRQGLVMSTMSKTGTCWWVAQLQATPKAATPFLTAPAFDLAGSGTGFQTGATQAGTYYAKQQNSSLASCNSVYPTTKSGGFTWGSSFSSPGSD